MSISSGRLYFLDVLSRGRDLEQLQWSMLSSMGRSDLFLSTLSNTHSRTSPNINVHYNTHPHLPTEY